MSWTALFVVYNTLFASTFSGTQYAHREHFISAAEVAVIAWASMRLVCKAGVGSIWSVPFYMRPHHEATYFEFLLHAVAGAYEKMASTHAQTCCSFRAVPCIIVDGLQVSLCNDREAGVIWEDALATGCLSGCTARPQPGSKYCKQHQLPGNDEDSEAPVIHAHREVMTHTSIYLEYKNESGDWKKSSEVSAHSIRTYDLNRLPKLADALAPAGNGCSKDPRRGT